MFTELPYTAIVLIAEHMCLLIDGDDTLAHMRTIACMRSTCKYWNERIPRTDAFDVLLERCWHKACAAQYVCTVPGDQASFFGVSAIRRIPYYGRPRSIHAILRKVNERRGGQYPASVNILMSSDYDVPTSLVGMCFLQLMLHTDVRGVLRAIMMTPDALDPAKIVRSVAIDPCAKVRIIAPDDVDDRLRALWLTIPQRNHLKESDAFRMLAMYMKLDVERYWDSTD